MGDNGGMQLLFTFFFRLFLAFLAGKFLARWFGFEGVGSLVGLTLLFLGNFYLFDFFDYRDRSVWRRRPWGRKKEDAAPPSPTAEPSSER